MRGERPLEELFIYSDQLINNKQSDVDKSAQTERGWGGGRMVERVAWGKGKKEREAGKFISPLGLNYLNKKEKMRPP